MEIRRLEGFAIGVGTEAYVDSSVPGGRIAHRPVIIANDPSGVAQYLLPLDESGIDVLMGGLAQAKAAAHSGIIPVPASALPKPGANGLGG